MLAILATVSTVALLAAAILANEVRTTLPIARLSL
jgi:hypothetical protein